MKPSFVLLWRRIIMLDTFPHTFLLGKIMCNCSFTTSHTFLQWRKMTWKKLSNYLHTLLEPNLSSAFEGLLLVDLLMAPEKMRYRWKPLLEWFSYQSEDRLAFVKWQIPCLIRTNFWNILRVWTHFMVVSSSISRPILGYFLKWMIQKSFFLLRLKCIVMWKAMINVFEQYCA